MKVTDAARGKWRGILMALGVDSKYLSGKHGPCPLCQAGTDRFRFDNQQGRGTFFCSQCGNGDGFEFLKRLHGWDFKTACSEVQKIIGGVRNEPVKPAMTEAKRVEMLNGLWRGSTAVTLDNLAGQYLASRRCLPERIPTCLRFHPACPVPHGGGVLPAMIALVTGSDGVPVNIHRTFLGPNGKADIPEPRAMMPGPIPDGSAIRLSPTYGDRLGVGEGIETTIRASIRFGIPGWATISTTIMQKWIAPEGVKEVIVFGDNDEKFGGQAAAYALCHKLAARHSLTVKPYIPMQAGMDWADEAAA